MDIIGFKYSTYQALHKYAKVLTVALGYRDLMTHLHSQRVYGLALELGVRCGLDEEQLSALEIGSVFHDIGKIGIPDSIIMKPGRLTEEEWATMTTHTTIGQQILLSTDLPDSQVAGRIIRFHHEQWDGKGYPDQLAGEEIPVCARIVAIADSYDAMAVTRSYHRARSHAEIMAILHEETGKRYDPDLMNIFQQLIEGSEFKARDLNSSTEYPRAASSR